MPDPLNDARSVWQLDLGLVNAFLIDDGTVTLVDAGTPGSVDTLRDEIRDSGHDITDIDRVLVTHYDVDHVGGLAPLDIETPIYTMEPDASLLDGSARPSVTNRKGLVQRLSGVVVDLPDTEVRRLSDGDTVGEFTAYHTPGHTSGHVAFHHPELETAMLGDLVAESDGSLGTPPWPLARDDSQNDDSVQALADRDLSFEIVGMGHGDPLSGGGSDALDTLAKQ